MRGVRPRRVLIVATGNAATPVLVGQINRRTRRGRCQFALLVPESDASPSPDARLEQIVPALIEAAGEPVERLPGGPDAVWAIDSALQTGDFDEVIMSTSPALVARWLDRFAHEQAGASLARTSEAPRRGLRLIEHGS